MSDHAAAVASATPNPDLAGSPGRQSGQSLLSDRSASTASPPDQVADSSQSSAAGDHRVLSVFSTVTQDESSQESAKSLPQQQTAPAQSATNTPSAYSDSFALAAPPAAAAATVRSKSMSSPAAGLWASQSQPVNTEIDVNSIFWDLGDGEDWEDIPATKIIEMDSTAAQHQLFRANAVIQRLRASLQKTKLASSHHHLQSRLLMIETQELTRRQEVEKAILQREVDKLRQDLMSSSRSVSDDAADGPVQQHYSIMADYEANSTADKYRRRLVRAKRRLRDALKMVEEKEDEIDRLKGRPGARGSADQQRQSGSSSHHQSRPRRRGGGRPRDKNEEGALAALGILASQVLSQQQLDESESHEGSTVGSVAGSLPASPVRGVDAAGRINADMTVAPSISEAQRLRMSGHRLPARALQHHQQQDNEATDPADTDVETGDGETETEDNNDSSVGNAAAAVAAAVESEVAAISKKASQSEDSATEPIVDGEDVANITEISEETGLSSTATTTTTTAKAEFSTTPASSVTQPHFDPDITLDAPSSPPIAASGFQSINLPAKTSSTAAAAADPKKRRRNSSVSTVSSVSGEYGAEGLRKQKLEVAR